MDWKFFAGILVPAIGACFVWMTGVARKDPPLWALISRTIKWRLPAFGGALFGAALVGASQRGWAKSADIVFLALILFVALGLIALSLQFFDKVAELPAAPKD
ncbi:hypothetical protein [Achromobacter insuavis]|uniref:hypothetical protein n=1 Tax=Achromobacter insuavis TaxID=1287735 RepID=UPI001F139961|nr:hypothetical protein [Achromobacter insuavis]